MTLKKSYLKEPHYRGSFFIDSKKDMAEMFRHLTPRYDLLNHLFSLDSAFMRKVSWLYFRLIVMPLGNLIVPRKLPVYRYLVDTIEAFYTAAQMRHLFRDVGFRDVHTIRFNLGTVALTVEIK